MVSLPDLKKGEQILLLTDRAAATREDLIKFFRTEKISELAIPKKIIVLDNLRILGTGKVDYQKAKTIAIKQTESAELERV